MVDGGDSQQCKGIGQNHCEIPDEEVKRPPSTAWIPAPLLADTVDLFGRLEGRPISEDEAVEILTNVKRYGEILFDVLREQGEARS